MSWLGHLFGSESVVKKGVDLIDNAFYTDQEKASQKLKLLNSYEPYKLAQRYLAVMFCFVFLISFLVGVVFVCLGRDVDALLDLVSEFYLWAIVLTIISFYFGGGFIESFVKTKKTKKTN